MSYRLLFLLSFILCTFSKCAYRVNTEGMPEKLYDGQNDPHMVEGLTQCVQYNGKMGCCDQNNDIQQVASYTQIDGIFGSKGDGCDLCAINLKRFWCEYACSPNQASFTSVSDDFQPVPNPQKPDETIMVQMINLTIHADTACSLYNSCSRIGFVTSVSAMGSPAGFLTFQGHNAVNQAYQYISTNFSFDFNKSLHFADFQKNPQQQSLQPCNYTTTNKKIHGFDFYQNCSCNNCQNSCDKNSGFVYEDSAVLEDFNWVLVGGVWGGVLIIAAGITFYRNKKQGIDYQYTKQE